MSYQKGRKRVLIGFKPLSNHTRWCGLGNHAKRALEGGGGGFLRTPSSDAPHGALRRSMRRRRVPATGILDVFSDVAAWISGILRVRALDLK